MRLQLTRDQEIRAANEHAAMQLCDFVKALRELIIVTAKKHAREVAMRIIGKILAAVIATIAVALIALTNLQL